MASRTVLAFLGLLWVGGCGGDESSSASRAFQQRDSADIQISESPGTVLESVLPWTLDPEPELQLGTLEGGGPTQFHQVRGMAMPATGGLVVANAGSHELRWLDDAGQLVNRLGGEGDGPGKFRRPQLIPQLDSDSLLVFDGRARRFTVVAPDGSSHRLLASPAARPLFAGAPVAALGSMILFRTGSIVCLMEEYCETSLAVRWVDPTREVSDTLLTVPRRRAIIEREGVPHGLTAPTDPRPAATVGPDGPIVGPNPRFELLKFDAEGGLRSILRVNAPERHMDEADLDWLMKHYSDRGYDPGVIDEMLDRMGVPDAMPAFQSLHIDRLGWLWAELFRLDQTGDSDWLVFDPRGAARGTIALPSDLEVHEIGEAYVLGRWVDELGVEYVRRYRLHRSR